MIQRRNWYVVMAVSGLAVACVVGLALAQELDEDGAIVSEEMLLEDAVEGVLDDDVDDLLVDDLGDDLDDLLSDDLVVDSDEVAEDTAEDMAADLDDLLVDDAIPEPVAEDIEGVVEEPVPDVVPDVVAEAIPEDMPDLLDDDIPEIADEDVPEDVEMVAEEPVEDIAVEELEDMVDEAPVDDVALEDIVDEPAIETDMDDLLVEPVAEAPEVLDDSLDDLLADEPEMGGAAEPIAEDVIEDVAVEEPLVDDVALDEGSDLDLLVEGALDDDIAEGVPDVPVLEADEPEAVEPEDVLVDLDEEPVDDLFDDMLPDDDPGEVVLLDDPEDEAVVEEMVDDLTEEETPEDPIAAVEDPPVVEETPEAPIMEPAVVELTQEEKAELAMRQELDVMGKQEELRRRALEAHGREVLAEAEAAAQARDYKDAERLFEEAKRYITDRPATQKTRDRMRAGMGANYFEWAKALQRKGEIPAATELANRALGFRHPRAAEYLEELAKKPAPVVEDEPKVERRRDRQPDFISKQKEIADLLRTGRQHLINGEYDRAQSKFEAVLQPRLDPQNTEAIRLIQKVTQKRYDRASMELEGTRGEMMTQVRQAWNPRDYGLAEAVAQKQEDITPVTPGTQGIRDRIRLKMEQIKIPEIDFRQANIHDVVEFLQMASVDFDPEDVSEEEKGVNIILSLGEGDASAEPTAPPSDDPFASMLDEGGGGASGQVPLITFTARYISLLEALKIVTQVANLKYRIEGSVVMIVPFNAADGDIVVRMYDVLPAVEEKISLVGSELDSSRPEMRGGGDFIAIESTGVGAGGADWKAFFADMGVEWPTRSSIKYVRTIGKIVVANTEKNLAVFEKVLEVLNVVPSQIEIEARFVEVTQTDLDSLGFEWMLDNTWQLAEKKGQGHLPPSARQRIEVSGGGANGSLTGGNRYFPTALGATVSASTAADSVMKIGSVLTNPELSMVLHMLQQRGHADLLSAPKITTKSGNEASIKVVTEYIYPTDFEIKSLSNLGGGSAGSTITLPEGVSPFAAEPSGFETREVGVILSVLPEVSTEGQMINLNMTPEVVSEPTWKDYGLSFGDIRIPMEQPFFHTRSLNTSISIYNGATVVMGGMINEQRADVNDKVPFLGDIPLIGRLFRSSYEHSEKRNLLIFVTARLVDPNGLPIKKQEEVALPDGLVSTANE